MTPTNRKSSPWWQTLVVSVANLALTILANHFLGAAAAGVVMATGTAAAHVATSPLDQ